MSGDVEGRPRSQALRRSLPGLFAVLVALAVEEWRDERQMREFAARVEAVVRAELQANLEEFRTTGPALTEMAETLGEVLRAEDIGASRATCRSPSRTSPPPRGARRRPGRPLRISTTSG